MNWNSHRWEQFFFPNSFRLEVKDKLKLLVQRIGFYLAFDRERERDVDRDQKILACNQANLFNLFGIVDDFGMQREFNFNFFWEMTFTFLFFF